MFLTESSKKEIKRLAIECGNEEICGLIVNSEVFPCKNISINPKDNFILSPLDYLKVSKVGKIQAIYHSHLGDKIDASLIDKDTSVKHNLPIITFNIKLNTFDIFSQNLGISYVGKSFKLGKSDCFTLLRDYYKEELGIELPGVSGRNEYSSRSNLFDKPKVFGFIEVKDRIQNDVIISKNKDSNHIMIYLGYSKVLHQPMNAESLIQDLDYELEKEIVKTLRYESLV